MQKEYLELFGGNSMCTEYMVFMWTCGKKLVGFVCVFLLIWVGFFVRVGGGWGCLLLLFAFCGFCCCRCFVWFCFPDQEQTKWVGINTVVVLSCKSFKQGAVMVHKKFFTREHRAACLSCADSSAVAQQLGTVQKCHCSRGHGHLLGTGVCCLETCNAAQEFAMLAFRLVA